MSKSVEEMAEEFATEKYSTNHYEHFAAEHGYRSGHAKAMESRDAKVKELIDELESSIRAQYSLIGKSYLAEGEVRRMRKRHEAKE